MEWDTELDNAEAQILQQRIKQKSPGRSRSEYYPTECWEWGCSKFRNGYGQLKFRKENCGSHRLSFLVFCGPIPNGLRVLHRCHNKGCVNPEHLRLGTNKDNSEDMVRAGRVKGRPKGYRASKETRRRNSLAAKRRGYWEGENNPWFGKSRSGSKSPNFGRKWKLSSETKQRMREGRRKYLASRSSPPG